MMIRVVLMAALAVVATVAIADAAAQSARRPPQKIRAVAGAPTSLRIAIRDRAGAPVTGVRLVLSGAGTRESTTRSAGAANFSSLKPGLYRVRCERDGFVTLEREFTVRAGASNSVSIVLNAIPSTARKPASEPTAAPAASTSPMTTSIPDFIERNFIGREPLKESVLACNPLETVRLLQMRERVMAHVHQRVDEVVYVVAGEGVVRVAEQPISIHAGSLVIIPKGVLHGFERGGRNPLIVVSTLAGSPCESPAVARNPATP